MFGVHYKSEDQYASIKSRYELSNGTFWFEIGRSSTAYLTLYQIGYMEGGGNLYHSPDLNPLAELTYHFGGVAAGNV